MAEERKPGEQGNATKPRRSGRRGHRKPKNNGNSNEKGNNNNKYRNDVSWYTKYPQLVQASSSIIFNKRYGDTLPATNSNISQNYFHTIPGLVQYEFVPLYADNGQEASPINVASKNLYTYIRHANSGAANYESSDLMQYLVTVMHLYVLVEQLKRDLRLVATFSPLNRYVYRTALQARGYSSSNIDAMITNQANNVSALNLLVAQLNSFKIPKDMPLLDRFQWLVTNVWRDDDLNKTSYYMFTTRMFAHYDWANRKIQFTHPADADFSTRLTAIQGEINNLNAYEDIGIMLGDILKAYKQEGCRVLSPIGLGEIQDAGYSAEALMQFTNAYVAGGTTYSYDIEQVSSNSQLLVLRQTGKPDGIVEFDADTSLAVDLSSITIEINPLLSIDSDTPDNSDVIVATRLMAKPTLSLTFDGTYNHIVSTFAEYPTELILRGRIFSYSGSTYDNSPNLFSKEIRSILVNAGVDGSITKDDYDEFGSNMLLCLTLDKVSFNPNIYFFSYYDDGGFDGFSAFKTMGKNVITVSGDWLNALHRGCKLSEFTLPMFKLLESN